MSAGTAVVLAAGEGTRLRPLTQNRPKPMLPAANRPILEHVLDALVEADIDRLVLVVGYRRERVQDHFGSTYRGVDIDYVHQDKQLGSGHALLQAQSSISGPMLVVNGDRLIESKSVEQVRTAFEAGESLPTMAVIEHENTSRYGVVSLDGDRVTEIVEKPQTDDYRLINAGIYAFDESIFETIARTPRRSGELALTDSIAREIERNAVRSVHIDGLWVDATYPWDLLSVASEILDRGRATGPETRAGIWIADAARVHDDATLRAPVVVGPNCEIGPGSVIGPNVSIAANTTIEANVTIERSVLDSDCRVAPGSTLVDAVLGQNVHLGVGTVIPGGPSDVRIDNTVFEAQPLGAVLADRVRAASSVSFAAGTLVGTNASIGAGCHVTGRIREDAEVVR